MGFLLHKSFLLLISLVVCSSSTSRISYLDDASSLGKASDVLTHTRHITMSITLELIAEQTDYDTSKITIFAPPDPLVANVEPSWRRLLLHYSPLYLSPDSLASLPFSSTLPSLSPKQQLAVTSTNSSSAQNDRIISIDNVRVSPLPIYDDGESVIVYAIENLFDLDFALLRDSNSSVAPRPSPAPSAPSIFV